MTVAVTAARTRRVLPSPVLLALTSLGLSLNPLSAALAQICKNDQTFSCQFENDSWNCQGRYPTQALELAPIDPSLPVSGIANQLSSPDGILNIFGGGVKLERGPQSLKADQVSFNRESQIVSAEGRVHLQDARTEIYARKLESSFAEREGTAEDVRFALKDGRGNGSAHQIELRDEVSTLKRVRFSTCPAEAPSWMIKATEIKLDHANDVAYAREVRVQIGNVPVLYAPYLSFPLSDQRKSGLLAPTIGFNDEGFDYTQPYYLNLAPNYDATLYPRWLSERGVSLGAEFRYLSKAFGTGEISGNYLPDDRKLDQARHTWRWLHQNALGNSGYLAIDINQISDDSYFDDLGDSLSTTATSVVPRSIQLVSRGPRWQASLMADEYEVIDPTNPLSPDPYRRLPRAFASWNDYLGPLNFGIDAEWVRFDRDRYCLEGLPFDPARVIYGTVAAAPNAGGCTVIDPTRGTRADVQPFVGLSFQNRAAFLRSNLAWRHTRYSLERVGIGALSERSPTRSMPIFSVDTGLFFERDNAFGNGAWKQSLEPRLYYLRVPTRDQDELPVFDSAELDFSFPQLFRTNRFTGADRQGDANQLTLALQSGIWDEQRGKEIARFAVGSILYFDDSLVELNPNLLSNRGRNQSVIVAEAQTLLNDEWDLSLGVQYDPELNATRLAAARLQRRFQQGGVVNMGYRYRVDRLKQMDISTVWPVRENLSLYGRWNFSFNEDRTLEALAGFEYRSCCFAFRLLGRRYLRAASLRANNGIYLEIELDGLGSVGRKTSDLLERAIFGFVQP
jgi:LPS-assembly protein